MTSQKQRGARSFDHIHRQREALRDYRKRFVFSTIVSIPILIYSPVFQYLTGSVVPTIPYQTIVLMCIGTAVFIYGGWPFLYGWFSEFRQVRPGMMTLIGVAITVAYSYSVAVLTGFVSGVPLLWEVVTLIDVMLLGHWIETRAVLSTEKAMEALGELLPKHAFKKDHNGSLHKVSPKDLSIDDYIVIKPGGRVPTDGVVIEGTSKVDESAVTGESIPVIKQEGETVVTGSVNGNGSLTVRVTATVENNYLSQINSLIIESQKNKTRIQTVANTVAAWLVVIALGIGVGTLYVWVHFIGVPFDYALERAIAVIVITCPHALGLAIPLVVSVASGISAKQGILIRNRDVFERARNTSAVVFDKTGTLTKGKFVVEKVLLLCDTYTKQDVLDLASSAEMNSEHSTARAIKASGTPRNVRRFEAIPGRGIQAQVYEDTVVVANRLYCNEAGKKIPNEADELEKEGYTVSFVIINGELTAVIAMTDTLRETSHAAINELHERAIDVVMITGDSEIVASNIAHDLNIDVYQSNVEPKDKVSVIAKLTEQYETVAMVGDGINDAPALARADVGIAIGSGTHVAVESADVILARNDPRLVITALDISKRMYKKMIQNLWWAIGYNIVAIPVAAGVFVGFGIVLSPAISAIFMIMSTIIVSINALHLKYIV